MKRLVAITLALVLLGIGSLTTIAITVNADKDTVTHTEKVIYGDPSALDGAVVKSVSHYDNHLVWNNKYTFGKGTESEFKFHFTNYYNNGKPHISGFILGIDFPFGFNVNTPASEQQGLAKVYKELYDRLDYDETGEITICLADYYEYYPLRVNINLPNVFWDGSAERINGRSNVISTLENSDDEKIFNDISEFFKIPVLKSEYADISVTKHRGNAMGFGHGWSEKATDTFAMNSRSAYTDQNCFIWISNRTENGNFMDFSNIEGGYGIYSLPYEYRKLKTEELSMVYKLDEDVRVNYMMVSDDQKQLILTVVEDNISYLEVIDIKTMTQIQRLKIADGTHYIVFPNEGFIAYEFEKQIAVITEKDGVYSLAFVADKFFIEHTDTEYFHLGSGTALAFDGERLAVVDNLYFAGEWRDKCGFFAAVYTKDGLQYFGEYESSLDANYGASTQYSFLCRSLGHFEVRWNGE